VRKLILLALFVALLPTQSIAQTTECDGSFHAVHSDLGPVALNDVDFTASEGWAVGFDYAIDKEGNETGNERPLVVRFGDDSIEKITPPHDPAESFALQGVAALAPDDVHVVGISYGKRSRRDSHGVAFHWDGTTWEQSNVPSPGRESWLLGVSATGPDDIWAVGLSWMADESRTLTLHYDGSTWLKFPSPSPPGYVKTLNDVSGVSSTEAWAVGSFSGRYGQRDHPLLLRWNGTEWKRKHLSLQFPRSQKLLGIDVISPDDIWVVGVGSGRHRPLMLHFNGRKWSKSELPDMRGWERLNDVAGTATQAWMAGSSAIRSPYETSIPLAARWAGDEWQHVSYEGDEYGSFEAVTMDDAGAAWAVGSTFDPQGTEFGDVIEKACLPG
jgi:hypothetical protein